jgi:hypothetical protein
MLRHPGFFIAVALLTVAAACGRSETRPAHENPTLIHERIWIEKAPRKLNELTHVLGLLEEHEPFGFFAQASAYKQMSEVFNYKLERDRLFIRFPQDGREATVKLHIERCSSEVRGADLCLQLDSNPWGGPKRYYGVRVERARELVPSLSAQMR